MSPDDMNDLSDAQSIAIDSPNSIDAHAVPIAIDNPSSISPPGPTIQSIVTEWLPDAQPIRINNDKYIGCLAALYHATWKQQRPEDVFVTQKVVRDPVDARASVDVRDYIVALQWTVDGQTPSMLLSAYKSRAILVRDEYKFMLARIWEIIGEDGGTESGYVPKPEIDLKNPKKSDQTSLPGPPYNPYEGLQIEWSGEDEPPGVNISGTPGIGKSLFLLILLALRLLAKQPTVFQFKPGEFVFFHEDGVFHSHLVTEEFLFLPQNTWFLVDSNDDNILPPNSFIQACNSSGRKLIFAASPHENRFSHTKKNMGFATLWMEPFTLEEYVVARTLRARKTPISEKQLEKFFLLYGPSARDAYQNAKKPHVQKGVIENNIDGLTYGSVVSTLRDVSRGYFETKFSHHVLIARRLVGDATQFYVEFASRWVADLIYDALARLDQEVGLQLYRQFLRTPRARSSAGNLLEAFVLNVFPLGGTWKMHRMTMVKRLGAGNPNQVNQHWRSDAADDEYTLFIGHQGDAVKIERGAASAAQVEFAPVRRATYSAGVTPVTKERGFYIPARDNQPTFDAWIYEPDNDHAVIMQVTVQVNSHFIDPKGLEELEALGIKYVDLVVVSDDDGGSEVHTPFAFVDRIKNVYRMVY